MKKIELSLLVEGEKKCSVEGRFIETNNLPDSMREIKWEKVIGLASDVIKDFSDIYNSYGKLIVTANRIYPNKDYEIITKVKK